MEKIKVAKAVLLAFFAGLSAWLGNLAVPVFILMALMILDYFQIEDVPERYLREVEALMKE